MKKRTGIFGGSFDPVHRGHYEAAESFLNSGLIDQLLITLTPYPPHKPDKQQAAYHHRFQMLRLAFKHLSGVEISDIEKKLPSPSYTLQTLTSLRQKHPETLFFLCLGNDSLAAFHTWHKYHEIIADTVLIAAERPGYDISEISPEILEQTVFIDHSPVDVSSTDIRKFALKRTQYLAPQVFDYIKQHGLYPELNK